MTAGERRFEYGRAERIGVELAEPGAAQGSVARRQQRGILAAEQYGASGRWAQASQCREQRRFAGAVAAENGQAFAAVQHQVETVDDAPAADFDGQLAGFEQAGRSFRLP